MATFAGGAKAAVEERSDARIKVDSFVMFVFYECCLLCRSFRFLSLALSVEYSMKLWYDSEIYASRKMA